MTYEQLVTRRILRPLGMKETSITLTKRGRAARSLVHTGEGHVVPPLGPTTLAGAGARARPRPTCSRFWSRISIPRDAALAYPVPDAWRAAGDQ